jgi:hypothetical protein
VEDRVLEVQRLVRRRAHAALACRRWQTPSEPQWATQIGAQATHPCTGSESFRL